MPLVFGVFGAGTAAAEPSPAPNMETIPTELGSRVTVVTPNDRFTTPHAQISPFLYLNRCKNNCTVNGANVNDARSQMSTIPGPGSYTIGEFANVFGQTTTTATTGTCLNPDGTSSTTTCTDDAGCASLGTGAVCDTADYEWAQVVQCMKEVYSPYAITVQDTVPAGGVSYTEAIIAGQPGDIGLGMDILGIAPLAGDCSAQDNVISFSFANHHAARDRVFNICWTAAQETAHAFGLDHEFSFPAGDLGGPMLPAGGMGTASDGLSACNDPMTYSTLCSGEKFFRNETARCGEYMSRDCRCGGTQNSHQKLINVFGQGQSLIPPPTVSVTLPTDGATVTPNFNTVVNAGSRRGVARVELWLNGYKWNSKIGVPFSDGGQPNPASYSLVAPNGVPNGNMFLVEKAYDDLGLETDSPPITIHLGAPCTDDSACATGQHCNTGAATATVPTGGCYWDPPTGNLGDKCTFNQFCTSGICQGNAGDMICTQDCIVGVSDSCPAKYDCVMTTGTVGLCFPSTGGGGCCNASTGNGELLAHFGFAGLVLGFVVRRRKAKR
ncbi:MAG: Ig-like domain-containing protein [Acidobacteriota bacterium]